ncbi:MAG: methyltransferase domain-containing protein [Bacilli bacterium]|nr:methyltransferase domain-containing protein [Bacilli bacterium]
MSFKDHLLARYPSSVVDPLLDSLREKEKHGLYLNFPRFGEERLLSLFPSLKPHPIVPHGFYLDEDPYGLGKTLYHNLGAYYLMDPASMLPPFFLCPKPGERIADLCAAPGGKTAILSTLLGDDGVLLSNDFSHSRALEESRNVERLGLRNVALTCGDASKLPSVYEGYFDAVLLDAPCSGSAMFRKDPRLEKDWSEEKVLHCASFQHGLLHAASKLIHPGGRIMYSTCSFSYEEDEGSVLSFLEEHPDFEALHLPDNPEFYHHPNLPQGIHLFPHLFPGEGQFLCLLGKKGDASTVPYPPVQKGAKGIEGLLGRFGLERFDVHKSPQGTYSCLSKPLPIQGLSLIRYGVELGDGNEEKPPHHALAMASKARGIPLSLEQTKKYLSGETLPLDEKDGFAIVSHEGLNLGFVKVVRGVAKNHYPKGLRRKY